MSTRKTITVGRVKGSMVYSGTDFDVLNPLEGDLYLHNEEYAFYQYVAGNWVKVADLEEHSLETEGIKIATSDNYNVDSEEEVPTTKTVKKIVENNIGSGNSQEVENIKNMLNELNIYDYIVYNNPEVKDGTLYLENGYVQDGVLYLKNAKVVEGVLYIDYIE